jgi:hypothetical protein
VPEDVLPEGAEGAKEDEAVGSSPRSRVALSPHALISQNQLPGDSWATIGPRSSALSARNWGTLQQCAKTREVDSAGSWQSPF